MAGRPRKTGKREPNGRLSRKDQQDARDVVFAARRRQIMGGYLEAGCITAQAFKEAISAPITKAEKGILRLCGDRLYGLELEGKIQPEHVSAGHDFAARYLRFAQTNGIPRRTAKIAGYGAIHGISPDIDPKHAERAKLAHYEDCAAIKGQAIAGALEHVFRACVEDKVANVYLLRSGLDALIRLHK